MRGNLFSSKSPGDHTHSVSLAGTATIHLRNPADRAPVKLDLEKTQEYLQIPDYDGRKKWVAENLLAVD